MRSFIPKFIIFLILSRIALLVMPWIFTILLFPEKEIVSLFNFSQDSWNRWDAPHYIYLAQHGYTNIWDEANFIVFLPLYPLLIRLGLFLFNNAVWVGITLSTLFFIASSVVFYLLVRLDFPEKFAERTVLWLAIFPTAYFFTAPYTESLFFFLFVLAFYLARKHLWLGSGISGSLAALTRPFGILLLPALVFEWWQGERRKITHLVYLTLPFALSIASYLLINWSVYGNPLAFQGVLASNWHKNFGLPWESLYKSWQISFSGVLNNYTIMVGLAEALTSTLAWILVPLVFRKLRFSYALYYLSGVIFLSSTSFILSTPRYLLSLPPFFFLLAMAGKNKLFNWIWKFVSVALLFYLTLLFTQGQWAF